ncbi:hypothetical protein N7508_001785 [Penicillium antarcticum]|uniref:uncharacterized protein n=1 Tax=Penicillium antarcticum TaxID=416450 RepID=UPI00238DBAF2|nr:uncharacterized protein N7508_001785 [Penicillium antarcticum]KAJ5317277.1 hypothetical protein N7508_001785 [Penicillium antarcticum]
MSSPDRVLRLPRSDKTGAFVLIHVSRNGSAPLDITLTATEGELPYISLVKQTRLKDLRAKNYQGSEDDWVNTLSLILGQSSPPSDEPDWATGLETTATVSESEEDQEIVITIRKRVQTITQRLGTLVLKQDDEQAVELFDWTGIAAARADMLEQQVSSLSSRCHLAEDTIRTLNEQLEDLTQAKTHHETQLIANFAQLLNEKKLKIRNQQRLLASAIPDPTKVSEIQATKPEEEHGVVGQPHSIKRSARSLSESEDSDGFEQMHLDTERANKDAINDHDADNERSTPRPLEEENNSTTDDDLSPDNSAPLKPVLQAKHTAPPRRDLPFTRRTGGTAAKTSSTVVHQDAEETTGETDDDEL